MWENTDQKISEYGHFLRIERKVYLRKLASYIPEQKLSGRIGALFILNSGKRFVQQSIKYLQFVIKNFFLLFVWLNLVISVSNFEVISLISCIDISSIYSIECHIYLIFAEDILDVLTSISASIYISVFMDSGYSLR